MARALVADETVEIVRRLLAWCDDDTADLVLTTGGTGLSARDVTPEATRAVIEREAPGVAERLRVLTGEHFPRAALSRGLCGRAQPHADREPPRQHQRRARDAGRAGPMAKHAVDILRGTPTDHSGAPHRSSVLRSSGLPVGP